MDHAGQQLFALTYTLLIVHGCSMPNACHETTGDKTFTLARFHPTVTVRAAEGPVSSHPDWTSARQVCTYMSRRANTPARATPPESAKTRSSHDAHMPQRVAAHSVSKAAEDSPLYAHVAPHCTHTIDGENCPRGYFFLGDLRGQRRRW